MIVWMIWTFALGFCIGAAWATRPGYPPAPEVSEHQPEYSAEQIGRNAIVVHCGKEVVGVANDSIAAMNLVEMHRRGVR